MPWFKIDDSLHSHPKVIGMDPAALGLWVIAGSWCSANLTDGFVPKHVIPRLSGSSKLVSRLVDAGLWEEVDGGYRFHDWTDFNPTADDIKAERRSAARRQALVRNPELRDAVRKRDGNRCQYCGVDVQWSDRRGPHGGTYDHVDPDGPNSLANLVVCCRGCNSTKGHRTPEQAGMQIRPRSSPDKNLGLNLDSSSPPTRPDPTRSSIGDLGGEVPVPNALANRPSERCSKHENDPSPPSCGACKAARLTAQAYDTRQAKRKAELTAAFDRARSDPHQRCEHGTDAGLYIRPDTGTSPCALCRQETNP